MSEIDDPVVARVNEKVDARVRQEMAELRRRRALWAGVCPGCAGDVREVSRLKGLFTMATYFRCPRCRCVHTIRLGDS